MTLTDFMLARIAEDKAILIAEGWGTYEGPAAEKRLLVEFDAQRRIVDECRWAVSTENVAWGRGLARACRLLATTYADHPDYREEWRP